jgi:hypothetical protein
MVALMPAPAWACEPIIPFMMSVGGPMALTQSAVVLIAAIALKCILFAFFQKDLSAARAAAYMLAGNILTTFIGGLVAVMMGSGGMMLIGAVIAFALCWLPARRIPSIVPRAPLSPGGAAFLMTLGLVVSAFLFAVSPVALLENNYAAYWIIKLFAVYTALIVSIALTSLWEEWTIWKFSRQPKEFTAFISPVVRANIYVLLGASLYGAALMLPKRLSSPDFLALILGR